MEEIYVKSKMEAEDLKKYLYYQQFFSEKNYILIRVGIALAVGMAASFFSSEKLWAFLIIFTVCIAVLIVSPALQIRSKYRQIYTRNQSGAFSQYQEYIFGEKEIGMKSENETEYEYTRYGNLRCIVETNSMYIISYTKKQNAIIVKRQVDEETQRKIRRIFYSKLGDKYIKIKRL